jgi:hypothetical protein
MKTVYFGTNNSFDGGHGRNETQWRFKYTSKELLPIATRLREDFLRNEVTARARISALSLDKTVKHNDQRFAELQREVSHCGRQAEMLSLLITGYMREPEKEFMLTLEDMAFYELEYNDDGMLRSNDGPTCQLQTPGSVDFDTLGGGGGTDLRAQLDALDGLVNSSNLG